MVYTRTLKDIITDHFTANDNVQSSFIQKCLYKKTKKKQIIRCTQTKV